MQNGQVTATATVPRFGDGSPWCSADFGRRAAGGKRLLLNWLTHIAGPRKEQPVSTGFRLERMSYAAVRVPDTMANLAPVPDGLTDEEVLMCPDIMSTGFSGAQSGGVRIGDVVAVFAQGPIGLCATVGARLMGATTPVRSRLMGPASGLAPCALESWSGAPP